MKLDINNKMFNRKLFDQYSFQARLLPALLVLLPAAFALFAWTGIEVKWESALWALFGAAGGTTFLTILARNFGKAIEPKLWKSWGGAPTTQLLRHSGSANSVMRERWHKSLSKLLGKPLPTADEEAANPTHADEIYEAATKLQISKTRDTKKYHLLFKENMQYGFCRNLYAMKATGTTITILGLAASILSGLWFIHVGGPQIRSWVCAAVCALFLLCWIFKIKSSWVKIPAFAYAERLFESTETTPRARKTSAII